MSWGIKVFLLLALTCPSVHAVTKGPCNVTGYYKAGSFYLLGSILSTKQSNIEDVVRFHASNFNREYLAGKRNFVTHEANKICYQTIPNKNALVLFAVDLQDGEYSWAAVYGGSTEWWVAGRGTKWFKLSDTDGERAFSWGTLHFIFSDPANEEGWHPHDIHYEYELKSSIYIQ